MEAVKKFIQREARAAGFYGRLWGRLTSGHALTEQQAEEWLQQVADAVASGADMARVIENSPLYRATSDAQAVQSLTI
jgi:gluconate kinase